MATPLDPFRRRRTLALADTSAWRGFGLRWGVSLASLVSGVLALLVFRRGVPSVSWIVGYLVGLWLLFAVLSQLRDAWVAGRRRLAVRAGDYTVQTLHHGLLLFVLPGYFASTTFDAPTAPFFAILLMATLLTTVDPWYRALVHPRRWLSLALFAFALFAGLNVALPLLGVPPAAGAPASAGLAALALAPIWVREGVSWPQGTFRAALAATAAVGLAWLGLGAIPPAPVHLVGPTIARGVAGLQPVDPVSRVAAQDLQGGGALVAFTPVAAPPGLSESIEHRWRHEGREVTTVRLPTPVRGGRAAGFRTFSRKADFPPDARGRWTVDVRTQAGQLIGRLRFHVSGPGPGR